MKNGKRMMQMILCGILCAMLLGGCRNVDLPPENTTEPAPPSPSESFTVRFLVEGQTLSVQRVNAGSSPVAPEVNMEGYVFSHWCSERGHRTEPDTKEILADTEFTAVVYPDLSAYEPYLFADENGFVHPEGSLTGQDLDRALKALAVVDASLKNVPVPVEAAALTAEELLAVLETCFPEGEVNSVRAELTQDAVTRSSFARVMNTLLRRKDLVKVTQSQPLPRDVALEEDMKDVLMAVLVHEFDPEGWPIYGEAVFEMPWQPGFTNLDGWLYYADENGVLLRNGSLGTLTFGKDGRYTSGDPELDAMVAELITGFAREDPAADRETLLMRAFEYTRDSFNYVNRGYVSVGATGWETEKAKQMFDKGSGNCYNYAAVFWMFARNLGYDAVSCSGNALSNGGPHAWVRIEMDGEPYIFDPQLAWRETTGARTNWGEDMFKIPKSLWHQWRYIHPPIK